jgi:hypothetical protein
MELTAATLTSGGPAATGVLDEGAAIDRLAATEDLGGSESGWGSLGGAVGVGRKGPVVNIIAFKL